MDSFIKRIVRDHFSNIRAKAFLSMSMEPIASRALFLFVRHATLIRPLNEGGKLRLAQDFTYIEEVLSPICSRLVDLGESYRLLRSFKPLFHTSLKSAFQVAGWTESHYSQWLDEHESKKERLSLLRGTVENYTKSVQKSNKSEYVEEYPIVMELLKRGLA